MRSENPWMEIIGYFMLVAVIMTALLLLSGCGKAGDLLYGDDGDDEQIYQNTGNGVQIIGNQNEFNDVTNPLPTATPQR